MKRKGSSKTITPTTVPTKALTTSTLTLARFLHEAESSHYESNCGRRKGHRAYGARYKNPARAEEIEEKNTTTAENVHVTNTKRPASPLIFG
jgi:hypothetical protein